MNVGELLSLPELRNELPRVDQALLRVVASNDQFLTSVAEHLISAGGKRLRPSMAIASALATSGRPVSQPVIEGAAAVELVHIGSLYHDDVLDGAVTRRSLPSVNSKYGNFMAIIAGDYLLARASGIAATLGTDVTSILATCIAELCEGQVREQQHAFSTARTPEAYEACISGKTASLIAAAARIGAITSGMSGEQANDLETFGHAFGMAFQIRDDILDIVGTDEQLGKPAGNDLVEGVYTLPVIFALEQTHAGRELADLLGTPLDTPERDKARNIVRSSGGVASAIAVGEKWSAKAVDALSDLPDRQITNHFRELSRTLFQGIV